MTSCDSEAGPMVQTILVWFFGSAMKCPPPVFRLDIFLRRLVIRDQILPRVRIGMGAAPVATVESLWIEAGPDTITMVSWEAPVAMDIERYGRFCMTSLCHKINDSNSGIGG